MPEPSFIRPSFDAHIHVWQRQWADLAVGTGRSGPRDQLELMLALMNQHGVQKACVIAACGPGHEDNNAFVAQLCREHADRFVMLSNFPLLGPDRDTMLDRTLSDWPALGIRHIAVTDESPLEWQSQAHDSFWSRVDAAGLFVALNLAPHQSAHLPPLIQRWPRIRWLIDHMGRPQHDMTLEQYQPVLDLATYPNAFVKISGFYAFTAEATEYPYADLARFVIALRDTFGAQRLLWASDAPCVLDHSSYAQSYTCLHHIPSLTPDDLTWIFGRTASELFRGA